MAVGRPDRQTCARRRSHRSRRRPRSSARSSVGSSGRRHGRPARTRRAHSTDSRARRPRPRRPPGTASGSWPRRSPPRGVRGGAQHALRQRRQLARLRDRDADGSLGHVVAPGDHRRDTGERSGRARPFEGPRGGGAGALDRRRERRERWRARILHEDPVERVLRAVRHAPGRRPSRGDELLGGLGGREHADALAHDDAPVDGSEEHAVPDGGPCATAASTPAAFEHDCFSASVYSGCASRAVNDLSSAPAYVPGARYAFGGTAVCAARAERHGRDQDGGGHDEEEPPGHCLTLSRRPGGFRTLRAGLST